MTAPVICPVCEEPVRDDEPSQMTIEAGLVHSKCVRVDIDEDEEG